MLLFFLAMALTGAGFISMATDNKIFFKILNTELITIY